MSLRLLHVVPSYLPARRYGGPIESVHGLCKALAARGHRVEVYTTSIDGDGDSDVPLGVPVAMDGVQVRYFASRRLRRLYWAPRLGKALAERVADFDIVHLHSIFLWPTWAAGRQARRAGVPYVVSPRGMLVKDMVRRKSTLAKLAWIHLMERRNLEGAALLHVTSALEAAEAERFGFALPRRVVIPNGIDARAAGAGAPGDAALPGILPAQGPVLLFIGRVNWKKGLDRLIPALARVPGATLAIAGTDDEGYRRPMEELARAHGVGARVAFLGPAYGPLKAALLERCSLLVLPSYSENFGNVVVEAMEAGRAVVVTPEVGAAEIVERANAGVVVAGNPETLGNALAALLADPSRLREMGANGQRHAHGALAWDAVAAQFESAYDSCL